MGSSRKMHLMLFFTYGISLKVWAETGLLEREILLYERFVDKGARVAFITYGDEEDYSYREKLGHIDIIPFYAFTKRPKLKIIAFLRSILLPFILQKKIKEADVLKSNQMWGSWAAIISKYMYRKKLIIRCGYEWYRNIFLRKEYETTNRSAVSYLAFKLFGFMLEFVSYQAADKVIISNLSDFQFIKKRFKINSGKIALLGNYIDTDLFKPLNNLVKRDNKLLFVGRLHPRKNIMELLKALDGMDICLDIIGKGMQKRELKNFVRNKGLNVNFLGVFPNTKLPEIINRHSVYILPSFYENNPKSLLEAMACGCAVIGSDVDGIKELIKDNENGLLCSINADSIRRAINTLVHDKSLRDRLGKNARVFVVENCDVGRIVEKEYKIYEKLVDECS